MKQQIITYYLDYLNSGLNIAEFALKLNEAPEVVQCIISCGKELNSPPKWVETKTLIEHTLSAKNLTARQLAELIEYGEHDLSNVRALRRNLPNKNLILLKKLL